MMRAFSASKFASSNRIPTKLGTTRLPPVCWARLAGKAVSLKFATPLISLMNASGARASLTLSMAKDAASAMMSRSLASETCRAGKFRPARRLNNGKLVRVCRIEDVLDQVQLIHRV